MTDQPRVWGQVPLRNPDFVGREEQLQQLHKRLVEPGTTAVLPEALHGMGGIGKSQIVVEYIYRHKANYDVVWWISAEHVTQIRASFVELARELNVPVGTNVDSVERGVLEALRNGSPYRRWLLVFDNAEHPDAIRPFVPSGTGHVVVTSRNTRWSGLARTIEVAQFTRDESRRLLRIRHDSISDHDADQLADALGDLPLAVEQAASWRAETGMPVAEYLRLLEENTTELLKSGATSDTGYQLSVAAAWNVPLNRLRLDRPEALALLRLCAFFGPEPISRTVLAGMRAAQVPDELRAVVDDRIRLNSAIGEISRFSLAKMDQGNGTLQVHRLVQAVLRGQLESAEQEKTRHAVHLMLADADPGDPVRKAQWPRYAALLPHVISSRAVRCQDPPVRALISHLVHYLVATGDRAGATQLSELAKVHKTAATTSPTAFVTYTEDSAEHMHKVRKLGDLLESCGVNVIADWRNKKRRDDWTSWMTRSILASDYVLVIASEGYAHIGDGLASTPEHRSAQYEAALLRDLLLENRAHWQPRMLPVLLPGMNINHIPRFLQPFAATRYSVADITRDGIAEILSVILGD